MHQTSLSANSVLIISSFTVSLVRKFLKVVASLMQKYLEKLDMAGC